MKSTTFDTPGTELQRLTFNPQPRTHRSYGVSIRFYEAGEKLSSRLDYQAHVSFEKYRHQHQCWQVTIDRSDLYFDRHEPDLISEQLAAASMRALYPVKVDIDHRNHILGGLKNHQEIQQRWAEAAANLLDKFEGTLARAFVEKMNRQIEDPWRILDALNNDMFWNIFFHDRYEDRSENEAPATDFIFAALPYRRVVFNGQQTLDETPSDYGTFTLRYNGKAQLTAIPGEQPGQANASLQAQLDLDKRDGVLRYATATCLLPTQLQAGESIRFSAYRIGNEVETEQLSDNLVVEEESKKPKGFWQRIFN
ncbi:hypothetical protein [Pedobacter sp. SYP-B3415]|uniref:hypothetical protein n=1 Tax=Pedobacter sp. SYP-B3415 TaxID=2496641 RepID=UPI00101C9F40|nr:hypothetical protein [Pedobacter sp. SYP-B3415]